MKLTCRPYKLNKDKTFLLYIPIPVWTALKQEAAGQNITLHDYIINILEEYSRVIKET